MQCSNVTVAGSNELKLKKMVCLLSRNCYTPITPWDVIHVVSVPDDSNKDSVSWQTFTKKHPFFPPIIKSISVKCLKWHFALWESCTNLSSLPPGFPYRQEETSRAGSLERSRRPLGLGSPMKMGEETRVDGILFSCPSELQGTCKCSASQNSHISLWQRPIEKLKGWKIFATTSNWQHVVQSFIFIKCNHNHDLCTIT